MQARLKACNGVPVINTFGNRSIHKAGDGLIRRLRRSGVGVGNGCLECFDAGTDPTANCLVAYSTLFTLIMALLR